MIVLGKTDLIPQLGERSLTVGQTGSGKTAFGVWLVQQVTQSPIVLYDSKEEEKFPLLPNSRIATTQKEVTDAINDETIDYVIYRPDVMLLDDGAALDNLLLYHYNHYQHVGCYIDELMSFHASAGRAGRGLKALLTRGRSRGITVMMNTQRPREVSLFAMSEAQKYYIFFLGLKDDRKRVSDLIPDYDDLAVLGPKSHEFYFYQHGMTHAVKMSRVPLEKRFHTGYSGATGSHAPMGRRRMWIKD